MNDDPTVNSLLREEVAGVKKDLENHVKYCARWQQAAFGIGCMTLGTVASESPKVARLIEKALALIP